MGSVVEMAELWPIWHSDSLKGSVAEMAERQPPSGETVGRGFDPYPGGALEVWPCDFGPKQFDWLINQLGKP